MVAVVDSSELQRVTAVGTDRECDGLQREWREAAQSSGINHVAIDERLNCLVPVISAAVDVARAR